MPTLDQVSLALSDPIRLRILDLLAVGRHQTCCSPANPETPLGMCACDLLPELEIAPTRLSYHMKELREAGLVHEQRRGRWVYFSLDRKALAEYVRTIEDRYQRVGPDDRCREMET